MKYNVVACGGTFDFLHKGHKAFLRFAFQMGKTVQIGLTTDSYIAEKKRNSIASFPERKKMLELFLASEHVLSRAVILSLSDMYGPTIQSDSKIEALIVTDETVQNARRINEKRHQLGLSALPIQTIPLVTSNNHVISSSAIRSGLMDEEGTIFLNNSFVSHDFVLPQALREQFHKPFGTVLADGREYIRSIDPEKIITVGDVTTARFNRDAIRQKISVIDFIIERKKSFKSITQLGFLGDETRIHIKNPAGMITVQAWKKITEIIKIQDQHKRFILTVAGEEDLLVIPFLLLLPLGFHIFYGQPGEGLVEVQTSLENKKAMAAVLYGITRTSTRGY